MYEDEEIKYVDVSTGEVFDDIDILQHYGTPRRSGRYPWGSGENPYQRTGDFISRVNKMKSEGKTESEIARELGIFNYQGQPSPSKLRSQISIANNYRRSLLSGSIPAHEEQLYIYAALFCLEYDVPPEDIQIELRIYQNDDVLIFHPEPAVIRDIMDKGVAYDQLIEEIRMKEAM